MYLFCSSCEKKGTQINKGIRMRHPFTLHNWKYHKENSVQYQEAIMIIMSDKKQEELSGKRKIQCAITSLFPEY